MLYRNTTTFPPKADNATSKSTPALTATLPRSSPPPRAQYASRAHLRWRSNSSRRPHKQPQRPPKPHDMLLNGWHGSLFRMEFGIYMYRQTCLGGVGRRVRCWRWQASDFYTHQEQLGQVRQVYCEGNPGDSACGDGRGDGCFAEAVRAIVCSVLLFGWERLYYCSAIITVACLTYPLTRVPCLIGT